MRIFFKRKKKRKRERERKDWGKKLETTRLALEGTREDWKWVVVCEADSVDNREIIRWAGWIFFVPCDILGRLLEAWPAIILERSDDGYHRQLSRAASALSATAGRRKGCGCAGRVDARRESCKVIASRRRCVQMFRSPVANYYLHFFNLHLSRSLSLK